ncbi:MAG: anti-sigma regulatory factor [Desulfobacter sp.]|nr:MAG: anti-sigma regulatory factor [Desulfobacter sp.]
MVLPFDRLDFDLALPSDNAQVVFGARKMLERAGFTDADQYLVASAVSELSTNIIRYAGKGRILLRIICRGEKKGIEVIAQDRGPGIWDVDLAMTEKHSTGNGLGLGLPSVKRIMDEFEIQSTPGGGTRVRAIKWKG